MNINRKQSFFDNRCHDQLFLVANDWPMFNVQPVAQTGARSSIILDDIFSLDTSALTGPPPLTNRSPRTPHPHPRIISPWLNVPTTYPESASVGRLLLCS